MFVLLAPFWGNGLTRRGPLHGGHLKGSNVDPGTAARSVVARDRAPIVVAWAGVAVRASSPARDGVDTSQCPDPCSVRFLVRCSMLHVPARLRSNERSVQSADRVGYFAKSRTRKQIGIVHVPIEGGSTKLHSDWRIRLRGLWISDGPDPVMNIRLTPVTLCMTADGIVGRDQMNTICDNFLKDLGGQSLQTTAEE